MVENCEDKKGDEETDEKKDKEMDALIGAIEEAKKLGTDEKEGALMEATREAVWYAVEREDF